MGTVIILEKKLQKHEYLFSNKEKKRQTKVGLIYPTNEFLVGIMVYV